MALNLTADCTFTGPALPEPFVKFNLEAELNRLSLLPKVTGSDARALNERWQFVRRKLRNLVSHGGGLRVQNHVIEPLLEQLGYDRIESVDQVQTREGAEDGGTLLLTKDSAAKLRVWCVDLDTDLDAPARRGLAYRFSHTRIAQRVLLASGERLGLLTNGIELRLIISDPARVDSQVAITTDPYWKRSREVPDSLRLLLAFASPAGVKALPDLIDKARLQQAKVTKDLREQARHAIREFIQELLDDPANQSVLGEYTGRNALAKNLWHEGLITVYRLLFILKLESTDDPARSFSFASTSLWRNTFSPSVALAPIVRRVLDEGSQSGRMLQDGIRGLFRMLSDGLQCTELNVRPMAGALFSPATTPILGRLHWSESAIAKLLDNLLWTRNGRGAAARERVHYGPLDVEDLGRVYEALLELEPGITGEKMCRLRRAKLEVVVPAAQGERYRSASALTIDDSDRDDDADEPEQEEDSGRGKKTKVEWVEEILPKKFYLRVGLGRKTTGSYYTPHSFVRFLVRETLGPLVQRCSPPENPQPGAILKLKVVDKAMGSGHFLVEACRFLGEALYDAARRCDEIAAGAEKSAEAHRESAKTIPEHEALVTEMTDRAATHRQRVLDLPDPDDQLLRYLPSRSVEGTAGGVSHNKAIALCRRMVAVHCLYGVDKNPLAVELAKLALWIECHAEGLPLTFLDHRLVIGDALTGPFVQHLFSYPRTQQPLDDLFTSGLTAKLAAALADALLHVRALEANVGVTVADIDAKEAAKARLDRSLEPFKILAACWSGGVMLGPESCDDSAYAALAKYVAENGSLPENWLNTFGDHISGSLLQMVAKGLGVTAGPAEISNRRTSPADLSKNAIPALSFDLAFPEVFYANGNATNRVGFDADLGNPPWDTIQFKSKEFFAAFDFEVLNASSAKVRDATINRLLQNEAVFATHERVSGEFDSQKRANDVLYEYQKVSVEGDLAGRYLDAFRVFMERAHQVLRNSGRTGVVVPSAFHANEGATGVRQLYLQQMSLCCCFSFENRRKLFEIDSRFKFAAVVAEKGAVTKDFSCAFYLHDDEWLFQPARNDALRYSLDFVRRTGGPFLSFLELRQREDLQVAECCYADTRTLGQEWDKEDQTFSTAEINFTLDKSLLVDVTALGPTDGLLSEPNQRALFAQQAFPLVEGRSFWHFNVLFSNEARYAIPFRSLSAKQHWFRLVRFFRGAYRRIASSTNERTLVFCILPPGPMTAESSPSEQKPWNRPNSTLLYRCAVTNSFAADYVLRLRVSANVSMFMLRQLATPRLSALQRCFLAHQALRLSCCDQRYAPLWYEQLGEAWREEVTQFTWPVLPSENTRWGVRAAIDAVVAEAYGLTRDQYCHVLGSFSHASYKDAPRQCLIAFDELQSLGIDAYAKKHDPYWDVPLSENLPRPVIEIPTISAPAVGEEAGVYKTGELFDVQTSPAPSESGALFVDQLITSSPIPKRGRRKP